MFSSVTVRNYNTKILETIESDFARSVKRNLEFEKIGSARANRTRKRV